MFKSDTKRARKNVCFVNGKCASTGLLQLRVVSIDDAKTQKQQNRHLNVTEGRGTGKAHVQSLPSDANLAHTNQM